MWNRENHAFSLLNRSNGEYGKVLFIPIFYFIKRHSTHTVTNKVKPAQSHSLFAQESHGIKRVMQLTEAVHHLEDRKMIFERLSDYAGYGINRHAFKQLRLHLLFDNFPHTCIKRNFHLSDLYCTCALLIHFSASM